MLKPQPMMGKVRTRTIFRATDDEVMADPNQLKQIFLNIILNAADAMTGHQGSSENEPSGTLTITTENTEDFLEIKFRDTGTGIPRHEMGRIFDPFYTTKDPGRGTGLGLSVCYRIIEGLGGTVRAESTHGQGTTLIIDIPLERVKNAAGK
jgi:two-component system NtrC family sensor kinase